MATDICFHKVVATFLAKLNYSLAMQPPSRTPPSRRPLFMAPRCGRDPAETWRRQRQPTKASIERLKLARHAQDNVVRKATERAELARHASLYRARQGKLSRTIEESEAAEVVDAELIDRQKEAAAAQWLAITRQLDLLQHVATDGIPPVGHLTTLVDRTSLPLFLQVSVPPSSLRLSTTSNLNDSIDALGPASPVKVAPHMGLPRPGEASNV